MPTQPTNNRAKRQRSSAVPPTPDIAIELHNHDLEASILGTIMRTAENGRNLVHDVSAEVKTASWFHSDACRATWEAMVALSNRSGGTPTPDRVIEELRQRGSAETVNFGLNTKADAFIRTAAASTTIKRIDDLVTAVGQLGVLTALRGIYESCLRGCAEARGGTADASEIATAVTRNVWQAVDGVVDDGKDATAGRLVELYNRYRDTLASDTSDDPFMSFGLTRIDAIVGRRIRPGREVIVGAHSGVGKTVLCNNLLVENGVYGNLRPVLIELESGVEEIQEGTMAALARVPLDRLQEPRTLTADDLDRINRANATLLAKPDAYRVVSMAGATLERIVSKIRTLVATFGTRLVMIDYAQMVRTTGRNREEEVAGITRMFKQIAGELNIITVVLTQLNDEMFTRPEYLRYPMVRDTRESKAQQQDADAVILIDRPDRHGWTSFHDGAISTERARLHVCKLRKGKTAFAENAPVVAFMGEYACFDEEYALALDDDRGYTPLPEHHMSSNDREPAGSF